MKYMVCPKCGIAIFYIINQQCERNYVKVSSEMNIILTDASKRLEGFYLDELFCLACSWHGEIKKVKKYYI